jgi:alpha-beta hydrolase superfamily lysophospholipase
MRNRFSVKCVGLLTAALCALSMGDVGAQISARPAPFDLIGASRCEAKVCAQLSLPELDAEGLRLGPLAQDAQGGMSAGPLGLTRRDQRLIGDLAGAGGDVFIGAMGHGRGPAQVELTRGAAPVLDTREEEVAFRNGDVALAGTLVKPLHARGRLPAIVAVLGSGPAPRWYSLSRARAWARLGYAVLVYDKRGSGASGGDWTQSSLDDLADDAVAGIRFLRTRSDIQADRIGMWAHSQGGWVTPRAMARGADAAFLVVVAGGGATPLQVEHYGYASRLAHMGVPDAELPRANATIDRYFSYLAGDIDLAVLRASYDEVRSTPWFEGLGLARVTPSEAVRGQWRWVPNYDPADDIAALQAPVLVVLAGSDEASPLRDSVRGWTNALARSGAADSRIVVFPSADHHMGIASGAGWRRVSAAYEAELAQFLTRQRSG